MSGGKYRRIAVIPARGGSQRLPRKALLEFEGKPLLAHTVLAALESNCFEKVVASSDDDEILDVASSFGAIPFKRDPALADSATTTAPVLIDVLEHEQDQAENWDVLACLYATAPLRTAEDISAVVDLVEPGVCDYAMAVSQADRPIHQALKFGTDDSLESVWPDHVNLNSQDAPQFVFGNGSTYAVYVPAFLENKSLYGPGLRGHLMPHERSVDIDTVDDFELLKFYAQKRASQ
ncbi:MAG: acylneuraminate cytidylyltransferase family protein [Rhodospirillaceae bacterium]|jgi:pseudaminic acid cytidylyltransferase|nr:acylneuraminate cytidylyltransferase family protein [Rhodospirillaceae bacterium]MBT5564273.1 acylneuraminate cytidylyltransferase family protein [Rhodospirillaceae bacterium]MBT6088838.1 acylneuraminate cytidylyltransferase family protein [Rhodospirillaceae bacterium]MBT6961390.1 acylneuraminate cytidylyltransferase family protein [Rhodospirillaceae bacterium]MBT7449673.1 acylneuraminate cytidylyltransferase family protein [Rhodospirillaceae bacterium]